MAEVIESGIGSLNYGRQAAKGTIATAASTAVGTNRIKHVAGGFVSGKVLSLEEYSDGNRFGSPSTFTNYIGGAVAQGLALQAQPENIGLMWAQVLGSDVVTGASDPYTHEITPSNAGGKYGTWWQKLGSSIGPVREAYWDSKIARLVQNNPRERNVVHLELDVMALKASQVFTTDPTKTEDTSDPYLLTESTGTFDFDGTGVDDIEDSIYEAATNMQPFWGNALEPLQLIEGKGQITASVTAITTDDTIPKYYKALYNDETPSAGDRPVKDVFYAVVQHVFTRSVTRTATIDIPRLAVDPANFEAMAPMPEGGKKPIVFGGRCLKSGSDPQITVTVLSADATTYA